MDVLTTEARELAGLPLLPGQMASAPNPWVEVLIEKEIHAEAERLTYGIMEILQSLGFWIPSGTTRAELMEAVEREILTRDDVHPPVKSQLKAFIAALRSAAEKAASPAFKPMGEEEALSIFAKVCSILEGANYEIPMEKSPEEFLASVHIELGAHPEHFQVADLNFLHQLFGLAEDAPGGDQHRHGAGAKSDESGAEKVGKVVGKIGKGLVGGALRLAKGIAKGVVGKKRWEKWGKDDDDDDKDDRPEHVKAGFSSSKEHEEYKRLKQKEHEAEIIKRHEAGKEQDRREKLRAMGIHEPYQDQRHHGSVRHPADVYDHRYAQHHGSGYGHGGRGRVEIHHHHYGRG